MSPACDRDLAVLVEELADGDDAFGLVADVDDDFRGGDLEDGALDDLAFRDVPEAVIVGIEQPGVLLGVHLVVVFARTGFQPLPRSLAFRALESSLVAAAPGRTGSVLVFYVRHALRSSCVDRLPDLVAGAGAPQIRWTSGA